VKGEECLYRARLNPGEVGRVEKTVYSVLPGRMRVKMRDM